MTADDIKALRRQVENHDYVDDDMSWDDIVRGCTDEIERLQSEITRLKAAARELLAARFMAAEERKRKALEELCRE